MCRATKLTHQCFADEFTLCCKGEQVSIDKLLRGFNHFSQVLGLQANKNKTEVYTCDSKPDVEWARSIWSRYNVPKHRFCWWIAAHGRLPTADRLIRLGAEINKECVLCLEAEENHQYLFFKCKYFQERQSVM
ncbi:putative E3 ubiquitin-protein ligase RF4 [Bienertia sinuspersici]